MKEVCWLHFFDLTKIKSMTSFWVMQQPYSDPASSYYTPAFPTVMDGDARYYVPSSTTSKYNGSVGLMTGPNLQASQEVSPTLG